MVYKFSVTVFQNLTWIQKRHMAVQNKREYLKATRYILMILVGEWR